MTTEERETMELELGVYLGDCREAFLNGIRKEYARGRYSEEALQEILDRFPNT